MKLLRWLHLIAFISFLAACSSGGVPVIQPSATATSSLPLPIVTVDSAPDPGLTLKAYLDALKADDYNTMYGLLSKVTQDSIKLEDFAKRNQDALNEMSASSFDYQISSSLINNPYSSQVAYNVTYHTALVGDIQRDMIAKLALENGQWKLNWDDSLILPELAGGNILKMDYSIPSRGNIYDRNGNVMAAQSDAYAFDVIPGNVTEKSREALLTQAWLLCSISPDVLASQIDDRNNSGASQYPIPLCEASDEESQRIRNVYPAGLEWTTYNSRFYFQQGAGSSVIGYTQQVPKEEFEKYRRLGYQGDEQVGRDGIEQWAENYLSGKHGGTLYVNNPTTGAIVTKVGESAAQPADSVYLTIDRNLQYYTEEALKGFTGAAVVIERDTGRVLAMASSPSYNSNIFAADNPNRSAQLTDLLQANQPFINRATQGQYPLGSVFKLITMSAGMESGLYTPETQFDCEYDWTKLSDQVRHDWTWQHCQNRLAAGKECNTSDSKPSGLLTLPEGLMRSCNPFFWDIGYTLFQNNRQNDIANMARAFGLGQPTGIEQIQEASGQINNPPTVIDVVNQAIGQGDVQVTPLQVARFVAALGNGGTLYRPQLVEKVAPVSGAGTTIFKPTAQGTLPVLPFRLQTIQDAMISVVKNPRGTANFRLRGLEIPVAGKTGTAESGSGLPHAWFAGYTMDAQDSKLPDIAIAVVLENQGEGSDYAAPIFRAIVETYYYGTPRSKPWYADAYGATLYTPTPFGGIPTETPKP
jgi:cell division protein FtsI/penicillin-binding protein 2